MTTRNSAIWKISSEDFAKIIQESKSIKEVFGKFGLTNLSNAKTVMARVEHDNLDISHMNQRCKIQQPKKQLESVMIENSSYSRSCLKRQIITENIIEHKCTDCGIIDTYNNKPLILQLEHKNGISNDHRKENLEFLCPNCHAQTETYCRTLGHKSKIPNGVDETKIQKLSKNKCRECNEPMRKTKNMRCKTCYLSELNKDKPDIEILKQEIETIGKEEISKKYNVCIATINKWARDGKDQPKQYKNHPIWKIDINLLKQTIVNSTITSDVFTKLNIEANNEAFYARVKYENIDITHIKFGMQQKNKDRLATYSKKISLEKILVKDRPCSSSNLRQRLVKEGKMENKCVDCGNTGIWQNKPLTLQLDHVNGDHIDNRIENLQIRCPNCHSQTDTFCRGQTKSKKVKKPAIKRTKKIHHCTECNAEISKGTKTKQCESCYKKSIRKIERPSYETLKKEIEESNYSAVGRKYEVTDNTIRKWVRNYEKEIES